jgi:hypothetical protein
MRIGEKENIFCFKGNERSSLGRYYEDKMITKKHTGTIADNDIYNLKKTCTFV